jgi:thiamine monophosphate synthase
MPDEAVQILERLLFGPKRHWQYVASMSEVGEILRVALGGINAEAAQVAVRIGDKLAERGEITYRPLVSQLASL